MPSDVIEGAALSILGGLWHIATTSWVWPRRTFMKRPKRKHFLYCCELSGWALPYPRILLWLYLWIALNLRTSYFVSQELRAAECISAMDTLCATWNPYATGNELDDHDGLDRSMRWLACEVIPLVTLRFLPPRVQHYWLPEAQRRRVPDRYSFHERWTIFLNNVIVPLYRSPLLPLQLMQGNCTEHHDCQRVERSYRARDGCTGLDGQGAHSLPHSVYL